MSHLSTSTRIIWKICFALTAIMLVLLSVYAIRSYNLKLKAKHSENASCNIANASSDIENSNNSNSSDNNSADDSNNSSDNSTNSEDNSTDSASKDTTIMFTGDICLAYQFLNHYPTGGINAVISQDMLEELNNADILMVNQEFPFSTRGTAMTGKEYTFRVEPKYVSALKEMGVDIVTLANNHTLDYGTEALSDTFEVLDEAGIIYSGAGDTLERASQLEIMEVNGKKIGFLSASRVIPVGSWNVEYNSPGLFCTYDSTKLVAAIKEAKKQCDFVAVYVHWGIEYQATPESYQVTLAKQFADAGADVIIGSHSHCLQGIQYFGDTPCFYSLGNFIFHDTIDRTAAVKITINDEGDIEFKIVPAAATNGLTSILTGSAAQNLYSYMKSISTDVNIDENGVVTSSK